MGSLVYKHVDLLQQVEILCSGNDKWHVLSYLKKFNSSLKQEKFLTQRLGSDWNRNSIELI